ncbi:MAG: hypothetical protein KDA25_08155 [Phycisphaerales bacterium]|nr:hypothetical protein [Phycisphaerales bacterium]
MTVRITRLAPSPTGALHLGNARTFLVNWALARRQGWTIRMRIEDLDGPRVRPDAAEDVLDILRWLGLDWDGDVLHQTTDLAPYVEAMRRLAAAGCAYPCAATRREIEQAASAPHAGEHELRYPPALRPDLDRPHPFDAPDTNYRFVVPDESIVVDDAFAGRTTHRPYDEIGDFVIWTKRGAPSYQLAVVVDDLRQGVTDVVRGDDLLPSAARQALLYRALGAVEPRWCHLPLVIGEDGRRLAKRHGDTRVETYRASGVSADRLIGLLACWSGIVSAPEPMTATTFRDAFRLDRVPTTPIIYRSTDHAWLLGTS